MTRLSKVIWKEGMYLGPHHFQAQTRYFEDLVRFDFEALWFEPYGFAGVALDAEALRNGLVSVVHARGVFPDGLPFHMPEEDPLPPPRKVAEHFGTTVESLNVALAIAAHRSGGPNCALSNGQWHGDLRYTAESRLLFDEAGGGETRSVQLGRKNIHLVFEGEPSDKLSLLPVARIVREGSGDFIYDPAFIAPCLQTQASEPLNLLLRRLIDMLEQKSQALIGSRGGSSGFRASFSSGDLANFWFLHTVNSSLAVLRHLCMGKRSHPEEVFTELSRLAGALCTFALDAHPRQLPLYDHRNPEACFRQLDAHIRRHLETILPTNCITIPLQKRDACFYEGEINDQRCFDRARWWVGVAADAPEVQIIARVPQAVKICSGRFIQELVRRAVTGLPLTHVATPPAAISPRVDSHYFSISRVQGWWDDIVATRRVGIYVPAEFPNPRLELLVMLE